MSLHLVVPPPESTDRNKAETVILTHEGAGIITWCFMFMYNAAQVFKLSVSN